MFSKWVERYRARKEVQRKVRDTQRRIEERNRMRDQRRSIDIR